MKLINREQIAGMNIHYLFYSLDYFLDKQAELGFKTIELWGGAPHFYLDSMGYQDAKEVRKKIESRGLQVKVFTPENVMYQYQMAAQTPELFEKSFQYFRNEDREEAWKRSREMISKLADEAGKLGICLAMESLRPQESQLVVTLKDAKRMYDEVNSPNLKILIDTTAMSVQGETIDDWFDVFGDEVIHTHFIDSNPYGHLAWGFGNRSLQEYLEALNRHNYQGCLGQELTEFDYYENPGEIDRKNMAAFEPFIR